MTNQNLFRNIENSDDAKQKRGKIWDDMNGLVELRKEEKREFTDDEQKRYDSLKSDFDALTGKITDLEADEKRAAIMAGKHARQSAQEKEQKELGQYSLMRAIKLKIQERNLDGLEGEMHQEAEKEMRDANVGKSGIEGVGVPDIVLRNIAMRSTPNTVTGTNIGSHLVPTVKSGLLTALRPRLVLATLGAQSIGNLQGNIDFPKMAAVTSGWKTEVADADASTPGSSMVSMSPNRLTSILGYSRQLLLQSSPDIEAFLINDLLRSIAQNVELAAINGSGDGEPEGILETDNIGDVEGDTNGANPTWAHILELESAVAIENADVGSLGYLTNAKVRGYLKGILKATGYPGFVWESGEQPLNGYRAGVTNLVPSNLTKGSGTGIEKCSAIIFGNFNDLIIGNWGGMDITVDPYTAKKKGVVEIGANTYWDTAVLRPESFAAMQDARVDTI